MLMLNVLIVEDDLSLSELYTIALRKAGYETYRADNGAEAWDIFERQHIDLIITDIMMPVMDGYEFLRTLRETNPVIPVLMITAKDDFSSKSLSFSLGTDDYMTKPVNINEMILRVKALLRRANIASDRQQTVGTTCFDYDALTVSKDDQVFMLPQKEFMLLYKLISYPGKIFTRLQLMDEIWGPESHSDTQTIDVHINRLRRRFETNPDFEIITVRGLGYKVNVR